MAASSSSVQNVRQLVSLAGGGQHGDNPPVCNTIWTENSFGPAASGEEFLTIDPSTSAPIASVSRGGPTDIDVAVRAARRSLAGPWRMTTPQERGEMLHRLADIVADAVDELAALETLDVGKPLRDARGDVGGAVATLRYNAGAADKMEGATIPLGLHVIDYTELEPLGVTGHITPWNFPLGMAVRSLAPALAAGCTAVIKPAEQSPLTTTVLAELAREAGFPAGVINVVTGFGDEAGAALCKHPLVDGITFTGSVATGRKVASSAGRQLKPVVLELGGKNPLIVFDDARLDLAVKTAMEGAFDNCGQVCSSVSRLLLHNSIADQFLSRFIAEASQLKVGTGMQNVDLGPLVSAEQYDKVIGHIESAVDSGGELLLDGRVVAGNGSGFFCGPTIIDGVSLESTVARHETFGPVVTVFRFADEDEAAQMANALRYGLAAGIHTRDVNRALSLSRRLEAGSVWINGWFMGGVQAPTGGVKDSGYGRERGLEGIRNYFRIKNIAVNLAD